VVNVVNSCIEYSFLFPLVQKYKNRPRKARVIIENKVARFYGSRCIIEYNLANFTTFSTFTACRKTLRLTDFDLCPCGETQTMSHIVEACPLTKLNGGLSQLHSTDDAACLVDQLWILIAHLRRKCVNA